MKKTINYDPEISSRADSVIAQRALTNSKRPQSFIEGVFPTHLVKGWGAYAYDTKYNRYIDFICGLGSCSIGHANDEINQAIINRLHHGITLSLGSEIEVIFAEKIKEIFGFVDLIRILKTGTDACSAAIKIARAYNEKSIILSDGYHGWSDSFVSMTPPAHGVHKIQNVFKLTKESMEHFGDEISAIIVEPVITDFSEERRLYLENIRKFCTEKNIVLIFDEIITGFRFPKFSVSNYFGIYPDLICLGKGMANGMPISVVGGKKEIMNTENEYFISSTFAGETLSIAAALKTIELMQTKYKIETLWEQGQRFKDLFNAIAPEIVTLEGYPTRGILKGSHENLDLFRQEACIAGILFSTSYFFNYSHIHLIDQVISTCKDIILRIKTGSVELKGKSSVQPFASKLREGEKNEFRAEVKAD